MKFRENSFDYSPTRLSQQQKPLHDDALTHKQTIMKFNKFRLIICKATLM